VQTSPSHLRVEVQPLKGARVETEELRLAMVAKLPAELSVDVAEVPRFEVPTSAKFRVVVAFPGGAVQHKNHGLE
jgi:hypothetical protein